MASNPRPWETPMKLFVVIPAYGDVLQTTTFTSVLGLQALLSQKGIGMATTTFSFPDIVDTRNVCTTLWYKTMEDYDAMLWVDSDMGFPPELVLDMLAFGEPLVGCIYRMKQDRVGWVGGLKERGERRGDFIEVNGVGFGVTLIRRTVIESMLISGEALIDRQIDQHAAAKYLIEAGCDHIIRAFDRFHHEERGFLSEDYSFCERWVKCGGKVWANIGHEITHVGQQKFRGSFGHWLAEQAPKQVGEAVQLQATLPF